MLRLLFVAAFVCPGGKALLDQNLLALADTGQAGWGVPFTPEATTDGYLRAILRGDEASVMAPYPQPTRTLTQAVAALPANEAILFIGPREDSTHLLMYLLTRYAAWPRPVYEAGCGASGGQELPPAGTKIAAVLYYRVQAPASLAASAQQILPHLKFVSVTAPAAWKSYCSP